MRVAINGFGRIGKLVFRAFLEKNLKGAEIVAINELGSLDSSLHLMQFDSIHGKLPFEIKKNKDGLKFKNKTIKFFSERNPINLPWKKLKVDIVLECSGVFSSKEKSNAHISAGAKKVIISAPASNVDATIVQGVNNQILTKKHNIISNGSCTTNCVVLAVKVLHDAFTINHGFMTTVHAYTGDQNLVDNSHKDLRRARAAALNIVPTSSGASKAVGQVIPDLAGKFDGTALRVPTPTVSLVDLTTSLKDTPTIKDINEVFEKAAESSLAPYLAYEKDELVSTDFKGNLASCIFDAPSTMVVDDHLVKTLEWYDNEWGYSCRLTDVISLISERGLE